MSPWKEEGKNRAATSSLGLTFQGRSLCQSYVAIMNSSKSERNTLLYQGLGQRPNEGIFQGDTLGPHLRQKTSDGQSGKDPAWREGKENLSALPLIWEQPSWRKGQSTSSSFPLPYPQGKSLASLNIEFLYLIVLFATYICICVSLTSYRRGTKEPERLSNVFRCIQHIQ